MVALRYYRLRLFGKVNGILLTSLLVLAYFYFRSSLLVDTRPRSSIAQEIEDNIRRSLELEKGKGCAMPKLDPFAKEVMAFDKPIPPLVCSQKVEIVSCRQALCGVKRELLGQYTWVKCTYEDIIFITDNKQKFGLKVHKYGAEKYHLKLSDHVKVQCTAQYINDSSKIIWRSVVTGLRTIERTPKDEAAKGYNVMIVGFDSTSRNGFIRRMPKSYQVLTQELKAVVLEGYNIVGDGTPAALFPIFASATELELPDMRKKATNPKPVDVVPFIWYRLRENGYRTAYFEDMPNIGTFEYRFIGFEDMPTDHYLRHFFKNADIKDYCVGNTPSYQLMLNLTEQLTELSGRKFSFTFVADISHDDNNMISVCDDYLSLWLARMKERQVLEDTLVLVMGDHGPRYADVRNTLQGKQEERLPMMAVLLPQKLMRENPEALKILKANAKVLTTPFDIHATLADVTNTPQLKSQYKVPGADLERSLSLLQPIPESRSCPEAAVEPHWCACLRWHRVQPDEPAYKAAPEALLRHINTLTHAERSLCVHRSLVKVEWVMRSEAQSKMLQFKKNKDVDGYLGLFGVQPPVHSEDFSVKIVTTPTDDVFEASMKYDYTKDAFVVKTTDISRVNAYGNAPDCISHRRPDLNMFCHCRTRVVKTNRKPNMVNMRYFRRDKLSKTILA